jgi:hypothetical protein
MPTPELGELARLLEDFDIDTGFVKAQRGGKTADSGTHKDDSHVKARAYVPCGHPCAAVGIFRPICVPSDGRAEAS